MSNNFSVTQQMLILEIIFAMKSNVSTQIQFCRVQQNARIPQYKTIKRIVERFRDIGSVKDQIKGRSGRKPSVRTPDKIEAIREALQASPKKSTRRLAQLLGTSCMSVGRIIHNDLKLHSSRYIDCSARPK